MPRTPLKCLDGQLIESSYLVLSSHLIDTALDIISQSLMASDLVVFLLPLWLLFLSLLYWMLNTICVLMVPKPGLSPGF